jgi:hypothetical protein
MSAIIRLFVLFSLIVLDLQAATSNIRYYVFPPYSELARRAAIQGTVLVEVSGINGKVIKVNILSANLSSPTAPEIKDVPEFMAKGLRDALSKWEFEQKDSIIFRLAVDFHLLKGTTSEIPYCKFSVREANGWPTELVIETDWPPLQFEKSAGNTENIPF